MTKEAQMRNLKNETQPNFVLWISDFFRHSSLVIRHSPVDTGQRIQFTNNL